MGAKGLRAAYLAAYNVVAAALWLRVALALATNLPGAFAGDLDRSIALLERAQLFSLLEIAHVLAGVVRGSLPAALLQAFGRNILTFAFVGALGGAGLVENGAEKLAATMMLAWSLSELCRYPYYALQSVSSKVPEALTYVRYSSFVVLYPIGAAMEALVVVRTLAYIAEREWFCTTLSLGPLELRFVFQVFVHCVAPPGYLVGFPLLYRYMLRQRQKQLALARWVKLPEGDPAAVKDAMRRAEGDVFAFVYGQVEPGSRGGATPFGASWCGDCTDCFPAVFPRLRALPRPATVLDLPVERATFTSKGGKRLSHPYYTDAILRVEKVPTLLRFAPGDAGQPLLEAARLVEAECVDEKALAAFFDQDPKKSK